jgi:hypothetical protein
VGDLDWALSDKEPAHWCAKDWHGDASAARAFRGAA